ncbi:MAG TPA: lysophospholipid acyltransferase family protein [Candidatus Acidoferrales bacterium]|nr:lysophospholipid acyltransferase family protein [Candidatus Acidoferrales bacterium]
MNPQSWSRVARLARLALHLLYAVMLVLLVLIPVWVVAKPWWRIIRQRVTRHWFRALVRILGLRITLVGVPADGPVLRVANHISWLDVVVLNAISPSVFVAKAEVAQWPLIGWMANWLGTLFLRRGDVLSSQRLTEVMSWQFRRAETVTLFPEGTTGNGAALGKFHARLYQPALSTKTAVQPVAIAYPDRHVDGQTHPLAPFLGTQTLLNHLWMLLGERELAVSVTFLPILSAASDRRELAMRSREAIGRALGHGASAARMSA